MPTIFEEPSDSPTLRFTFDDDWDVVRLDEDSFFRKRLMPLQLTGAVDFLCVYRRRELWFIEVKDHRGSRIELKNAEKMHAGDTLLLHVARKVKDCVACVVGAARHTVGDGTIWRTAAEVMHARSLAVKVVLWLECDLPRRRRKPVAEATRVQLMKQQASVRTDELKGLLSWLTRDVLVANQSVGALPGVIVENVGRAGSR